MAPKGKAVRDGEMLAAPGDANGPSGGRDGAPPTWRHRVADVILWTVVCWAITYVSAHVAYGPGGPTVLPFAEADEPAYAWMSAMYAVLVAPTLETVMIVAGLNLLTRLGIRTWLAALMVAALMAAWHETNHELGAFSVVGTFVVQSLLYARRRAAPYRDGFLFVVALHTLYNIPPAVSLVTAFGGP